MRKSRLANLTPASFLEQSKAIHGDKYDYSNIDWSKVRTDGVKLVGVNCRTHGMFYNLPSYHVRGRGCPECSQVANGKLRAIPLSVRLEQARSMHGDEYDYSQVESARSHDKVTIICYKHGPFKQMWGHHIRGVNCPSCGWKRPMQHSWLDFMKVPTEYREHVLVVGNRKLRVDGFNTSTNTVYEFFGNYWHGDPRDTSFNDGTNVNRVNGKTHEELVESTWERIALLRDAGYKVEYIFEREFLTIEDNHKWQTSARLHRVVHEPTSSSSSTL